MRKNDIRELEHWLEKLVGSEIVVVVEGKKDKKALMNIGLPADRIEVVNDAIFAVAERVARNAAKVVILTDLDTEGKKLYGSLKRNFNRLGVRVDTYFREFLFKRSDLSHIEGIDTFLRNLRRKCC